MRLPHPTLARLVTPMAASLALSLSAQATNKIVFLAGSRSHGPGEHEFKAGSMLLAKALNESGLDVQATVISGWPKEDSILDDAKAIVIYSDATSVVEKGWEKTDSLAKKGVGLMFMHYAVHPSAENGEKYFRPWIGGAFETDFSVNPHWVADLKALPNHPVSRGVGPMVKAYDEFYYNMRFIPERSKVLDLVTAVPTRQNVKKYINLWNQNGVDGLDKPQALMWGLERADGGRGVGFTGGHYHRNWAVDGFRTLALNAIVWTAKVEVPASGVKSKTPTVEELNANLDDKGKPANLTLPTNAEFDAMPPGKVDTAREAKFTKSAEAPKADKLKEDKTKGEKNNREKPKGEKGKDTAGKPVAESAVITSNTKERLTPLEAPLNNAKELWLAISSEGDIDTDWSNWVEPELVFADGSVKPLTSLKWKSAKAGWGEAGVGKSPDGKKPLTVDGKTYANGIGAHADSIIGYDLPAGVVKFRTKVAIDDGGYRREGKPTAASVRFRVFTQNPGENATAVVDSSDPFVPVDMLTVPEGLEVTLWAVTPDFHNPTNIDFDENGRLFVAEGVNYRSKSNRRAEGDRIVILEDSDGDGKADKSSIFTQETNLISPLGVAVFENTVIVSQPPELLKYTDVNRDGKYDPAVDKREVLLSGFNGRNHDHSLHSLTAGPDGQWYFNQGNTCALFTDKSGKTFRIGSPYNHGEWTKQVADATQIAGQVSDDGNVWVGGFTVKMNPDGTNAKIMGHNYRNSYEQTVTSFGDLFQNDNDDPPACRVSHILEGGNAGFASADGKRSWNADKRPGQDTPTAEWRQEDPGTMPAGDVYGGGSPTGVANYENGSLDAKWNGLLLACEPGKNVIYGYFPKLEGATFKLERFDFMTSNKEREFAGSDFIGKTGSELKQKFRPSDITVGPDGAIYVADWFDARVGGHGTMDNGLNGAIYRIAPKGFKSKVPKIDYATTEGQIQALKSPAPNVRFGGFTRLRAQGEKAIPAVSKLLDDSNPHLQARALWLLAQLGDSGAAKVTPYVQGKDENLRVAAYRALRFVSKDVAALAAQQASNSSAAVRREVAVSLRGLPAAKSLSTLVKLAKQFDGKDRGYLEALGLGATGIENELYDALAKDFGSAASWSEPSAWLAWRLHSPKAVADLKARAASASLSPEQRKLMVTALAFVPSHAAAVAMIELSADKDFIHKDLAKWWVNNRKGNLWSGYKIDDTLKAMGMDPAKVQLVSVEMPPSAGAAKFAVADVQKLKGDSKAGQAAVAACYTCHKIGASGADYGPDLTTFGRQQPAEVIINGIVNPSADISHGFEGMVLKTKDGLTITGMVLTNGDPVLIKSMGGQIQSVAKDRIESVKDLGRSLMFDPANLGLTAQGVADITAYLKSL